MPMRLLLSAQSFIGAKAVFLSWIVAGLSTFGIVERQTNDIQFAALWAAASAVGCAVIAGIVRVVVIAISTARSRREQREIERSNDFARLHEMYAERTRWNDERLQEETTILRIVRSAKHQLVSDIGARDIYIGVLQDQLRDNNIPFERIVFRNIAEAFAEEDKQVNAIVKRTTNTNGPVQKS